MARVVCLSCYDPASPAPMIDTLADASRGSLTLIESRRLQLVSFTLMYVAQGVGVGLFLYAMPAYFAQEALTPAASSPTPSSHSRTLPSTEWRWMSLRTRNRGRRTD